MFSVFVSVVVVQLCPDAHVSLFCWSTSRIEEETKRLMQELKKTEKVR